MLERYFFGNLNEKKLVLLYITIIKTMLDKQTLIERHLKNLIHLAQIDDHFDKTEKDLVYKIGFKNGLNAKPTR